MSWGMINGWREDFNEGPYDYLAVIEDWQIFQRAYRDKFRLTSPKQVVTHHDSAQAAKEAAYVGGCSRP